MPKFQVTLVDKQDGRKLDCGTYQAKDQVDAIEKAKKKYKNTLLKIEANTMKLEAIEMPAKKKGNI